jgi:CubicO group peptidase (beta-lactamase class C family)
MKLHWHIARALVLSLSVTAYAAESSPPASAAPAAAALAALDRELKEVVEDPLLGLASLSVLAVRDGKVAYEGQFGKRHFHPSNGALHQPANAQTLYRIASVSKFVTTLGVLRLVEQGTLSLDRDVSDYLGFRLRNPAFPGQPVTLRMLLTHTSSLRDEAGYSWGAATSLKFAIEAKPGAWDQQRPPGAWFSYCNLNWGVIGTVMEAATGERFDLLMQRLVLSPLGLEGGFNVAAFGPGKLANLATLYRKRPAAGGDWNPAGPWIAQVDDFSTVRPAPPAGLEHYQVGSNGTLFSPTGGLRISAADLGKIMLMLLDQGSVNGSQFLRPATISSMFSTQWRYDPAVPNGDTHHGLFTSWGLGVQHFGPGQSDTSRLVADGSYRASGHLGEAYGLYSVFAIDRFNRSGIVVLIGGTARDPATTPGAYSPLSRQEERVLTAVYERVLRAPAW